MVKSCSVFGCTHRANSVAKEKGVRFFKFPKGSHKRRSWIKAMNRKDWVPNENSFVCSAHFVFGWHSYEAGDADYAPSVFSYKETAVDEKRHERAFRRDLSKTFEAAAKVHKEMEDNMLHMSTAMHTYCGDGKMDVDEVVQTGPMEYHDDISITFTEDKGMQCDTDPLIEENQTLREENERLRKELKMMKWGVNKIKDDDKATRFYTGLPTYAVFMWLYSFLLPKAQKMQYWNGANTPVKDRQKPQSLSLTLIDQLFAVLMRLKVGLLVQDIADRFVISNSTFSNVFITWICLLHEELKIINVFPSRNIINETMPTSFKKFPNVRIILDCTEIFIQRSSSLINQNLTFSNYKHHNTMKFLIGITPSGVISFVSEAWGGGGRIFDRQIVIHVDSGILDLLEAGDNVMADKGFTIGDLLNERKCTLNILPFKTKSQFSVQEVFATNAIAQLRIHVERKIGRVKFFHLFDSVLPLSLAPIALKCFHCSMLVNKF